MRKKISPEGPGICGGQEITSSNPNDDTKSREQNSPVKGGILSPLSIRAMIANPFKNSDYLTTCSLLWRCGLVVSDCICVRHICGWLGCTVGSYIHGLRPAAQSVSGGSLSAPLVAFFVCLFYYGVHCPITT